MSWSSASSRSTSYCSAIRPTETERLLSWPPGCHAASSQWITRLRRRGVAPAWFRCRYVRWMRTQEAAQLPPAGHESSHSELRASPDRKSLFKYEFDDI